MQKRNLAGNRAVILDFLKVHRARIPMQKRNLVGNRAVIFLLGRGGPNQPYRKSQQKAPQAKILDLLSAFWVPQIRDLRTLQSKNINLRSAAGDFLEV